jgi:hypothetical protein
MVFSSFIVLLRYFFINIFSEDRVLSLEANSTKLHNDAGTSPKSICFPNFKVFISIISRSFNIFSVQNIEFVCGNSNDVRNREGVQAHAVGGVVTLFVQVSRVHPVEQGRPLLLEHHRHGHGGGDAAEVPPRPVRASDGSGQLCQVRGGVCRRLAQPPEKSIYSCCKWTLFTFQHSVVSTFGGVSPSAESSSG